MMRRVSELLGQELRSLWGGTFHSIGARILRLHAETLGYQKDFTILDRDDAKDLIKACMADAKIDKKGTHFPKLDVLNEIFSLAANTHKTIEELVDGQFSYFSQFAAEIAELAKAYADRKRATNAMDFDDLLALWLKLLQDHADMREHYQRRFQFILVDEYQDTNKLQGDLIDLLAARHHNVMVVGDDAQSIYAWRGANFANILDFPKRYPGAKVFKIETNYRSTPEILERGQRRHRRQREPVRQGTRARAQIRPETGAGAMPRRRPAGGVHRPARHGTARRRREPEPHRRAVSLAFSRAGIATGTDAAADPVFHHQRHPLL